MESIPSPPSTTSAVIINTAGTKVFADKTILGCIFGWIEERRDLVKCLLLNKEGLQLGAECLYGRVHEKVLVRVARAECSLGWVCIGFQDRLVQYSRMVKTVFSDNQYLQLPDKEPLPARSHVPSVWGYYKYKGRFPEMQYLRFSFEDAAEWRSDSGMPFSWIRRYTAEECMARGSADLRMGELSLGLPESTTENTLNTIFSDEGGALESYKLVAVEASAHSAYWLNEHLKESQAETSRFSRLRDGLKFVERLSLHMVTDIESLECILSSMPGLKRLDLHVHTSKTVSGQHKRIGEVIAGYLGREGRQLRDVRIVEHSTAADISRTLDDYAGLAGLDHLRLPLDVSRLDQDLDDGLADDTPGSESPEMNVQSRNMYGNVEVDIVGWEEDNNPFSLASKLAEVFPANAQITLKASDSSEPVKRWMKHARSTSASLVKHKARRDKVGFKVLAPEAAREILAGMSTSTSMCSKGTSTDQVDMGIWALPPREGLVSAGPATIPVKPAFIPAQRASGETAGTQVFANDLILHEILRWVRVQCRKTLATCLSVSSQGFRAAAPLLYCGVPGTVVSHLLQAECDLQRLVAYINMVHVAVLNQDVPPSRSAIQQLKARFPRMSKIVLLPAASKCSDPLAWDTTELWLLAVPQTTPTGTIIANISYRYRTYTKAISPLNEAFGVAGPGRWLRLVQLHFPASLPHNKASAIAKFLNAEFPPGFAHEEVERLMDGVHTVTLPVSPRDNKLQALLPYFRNITCLRFFNYTVAYDKETHEAMVRFLRRATQDSNPWLARVFVYTTQSCTDNGPELGHFMDVVGIGKINHFGTTYNFAAAAEAMIAGGSHVPNTSAIVAANPAVSAKTQAVYLYVGANAVLANPYHIACWLAAGTPPQITVRLELPLNSDPAVVRWKRQVEEIKSSLIRSLGLQPKSGVGNITQDLLIERQMKAASTLQKWWRRRTSLKETAMTKEAETENPVDEGANPPAVEPLSTSTGE